MNLILADNDLLNKQQIPLEHSNFKPIIIYFFVNPFCHDCWTMKTYIKKLTLEYGEFFLVRPVISHLFTDNTIDTDHSVMLNDSNLTKYQLLIAIKAAGLQGNKASRDFLLTLQRSIFDQEFKHKPINEILLACAKRTNLDLDEFYNDLQSSVTKKAYQQDINLLHEMNINTYPTLVIHNQLIDNDNLKVEGIQDYNVYVDLLLKMLAEEVLPAKKPSILTFLDNNHKTTAEEVAFIYNLPIKEALNLLKKLQLQQKIRHISHHGVIYWEVI